MLWKSVLLNMMIQPGATLKLKRTEVGKQSSLSDHYGIFLIERLMIAPLAEIEREKTKSLIYILEEIDTKNPLVSTHQLSVITAKMLEVAYERRNPKLNSALKEYINKLPRSPSILELFRSQSDPFLVGGHPLYETLALTAPGNNLASLLIAISIENSESIAKILNSNIDFSFSACVVFKILMEAFLKTEVDLFDKIVVKACPETNFFLEMLIDEQFKYITKFQVADRVLKLCPLRADQIQSIFTSAYLSRNAKWVGFWGTRGGHFPKSGVQQTCLLFPATVDLAIERFFRSVKMTPSFNDTTFEAVNITHFNHGTLRHYRDLNPTLYYFILTKRVALTWGFNSSIINPLSERHEFDEGFDNSISRLFWIDALRTCNQKDEYPSIKVVADLLQDLRNLDFHSKEDNQKTYEDIQRNETVALSIASSDHFSIAIVTGLNWILCDRGFWSKDLPGFQRGIATNRLSQTVFERILDSRDLKAENAISRNELITSLNFTEEFRKDMSSQKEDGCTITTIDAAVIALLYHFEGEYRGYRDIDKLYKTLTTHLRYMSAHALFCDVVEYLSEPQTLSKTQFYLTLLSGVYFKLINEDKLRGDPSKPIFKEMTQYLMKRLET